MKLLQATFAALILTTTAATAQTTPLFAEQSELNVVIDAPMNTILREARRSTDPHPAVFTVADQRFDITLAARGVSRRTRGICTFTPLRLDFDGDTVGHTLMAGQNRLKLVTRCRSGGVYEQLSVLEYLAYRLYNEITPYSFRVRPMTVTYRDNEGRRDEEAQWNFVIEDVDDLARRNGGRAIDTTPGELRSTQLDPAAATRVALFQYMIGNLDWDMVTGPPGDDCCHNSKVIGANADAREGLIPTPYDFDFSGFVDAPYATPPDSVNVRNVRTRYYRGYCRFNDQIPAAIAHMQSRRQAFNALIAGEPRLSASRREQAQRYIDDFFETVADPVRVQSQLIDRCRG